MSKVIVEDGMYKKQCGSCGRNLSVGMFNLLLSGHYSKECVECDGTVEEEGWLCIDRPAVESDNEPQYDEAGNQCKTCFNCQRFLELEEFYIRKGFGDGREDFCKRCLNGQYDILEHRYWKIEELEREINDNNNLKALVAGLSLASEEELEKVKNIIGNYDSPLLGLFKNLLDDIDIRNARDEIKRLEMIKTTIDRLDEIKRYEISPGKVKNIHINMDN